ncbi:unnamed protein product, partial [Ectocarpus sp. 12 AP-2014]
MSQGWLRRARRALNALSEAGHTRGTVLCLRGEEIEVDGERLEFPFALPDQPGTAAADTMPLCFPLLDDLRSAVTPAAEPAVPASAATTSTPGRVGQATRRPSRPLSKGDTPIAIGTSFSRNSDDRRRGVMAPVEKGIDHALKGTLGAMDPDVFGLNKDRVTSNYHLALFLSTLPNVVKSWLRLHPKATFTMGVGSGNYQDLRDYVRRLPSGPGAPPIAGKLREAAECIIADDSDRTRNPEHDLCLSPASADVFSLAVNILAK